MAYINGKQIIFSPRLEMTVDQEYNPESPRAQSGTAVAEAITEAIGGVNTVLNLMIEGV